MKKIHFILLILTVFSGFWACKDPQEEPLEYDRETLLRDVTDNYILHAYEEFALKSVDLKDAVNAFTGSPSQPELDAVQSALRDAWLAWESCSPLGFGPAANLNLRPALNTFPTDPTQIEANVMAGTWDLNAATNVDARGFPALDFLLHHADDATLLDEFTSSSTAVDRRNFLLALAEDVQGLAVEVNGEWSPSGNDYAETFMASLGTDAGSSTAALVNQLNFDLEQLKNARLGIPLGKKSLGQALPEKVECYYGGYSSVLAQKQFEAIASLYEGTHFGSTLDGYGLYECLVALDAQYNGNSLADAIRTQVSAAREDLGQLPSPLSQAIVTNNVATANAAYDEVQKLIILLKTDMPSAMSILITYTDNDGD